MTSTSTTANLGVAHTGLALVAVAWTLFSISVVVVTLRFFTRMIRFFRVGLDDYLMLLSLICTLLHSTMVTVAFRYGLGHHSASLTPENLEKATHYIIACEAFAIITVMFGRLSFCVFFLGLLGPTHKIQKKIIWVIIVSQVISNTIVVAQVYAQCGRHLSALWDPSLDSKFYCQSPSVETILGYIQGVCNVVTDLILTLLPGFLVWTLQMPRQTKFGLGAILMLSVFALVASILKCVSIGDIERSDDQTWNMVRLEIWCAVENNIVIISASIPTIRPLFSSKLPHSHASSSPHSVNPTTTHTEVTGSSCRKKPTVELQSMQRGGHSRNNTYSSTTSNTSDEEGILHIVDEILVTKTMQVQYDAEMQARLSESRAETPKSVSRLTSGPWD